jgi:hypothetical protein
LVGGNLIGSVCVPVSIPASDTMQVITTGNLYNAGIVIPSGYFGVETTFIGGNSSVEIALLSGVLGGTLDEEVYLDDNYDGWLTNNEATRITDLFGQAPAVEVLSLDTLVFTGTVILNGWMGAELPTIRVWVDGQDPIRLPLTRVDHDTGTFTIPLTSGTHFIRVKADKSLSDSMEVTL